MLEQHGVYWRDWYDQKPANTTTEKGKSKVDPDALSWGNMLTHWNAIETDFHHFYGVDFDTGILHRRRWRWFRVRVVRLLGEESRLRVELGL